MAYRDPTLDDSPGSVTRRDELLPSHALGLHGKRRREVQAILGGRMSRENLDLALLMYEAFNRRDLDAMLALVHDEVEIEPRLGALEGAFRGHQGVRRWYGSLLDSLPDYTAELDELHDLGDTTLGRIRGHAHGAASAAPLVETWWQLIRWSDGRCIWWRNFGTEADALETIRLEARMSSAPTEVIQVGALSVRFLVEAADSNGSASVFECFVPADSRMPVPHSHDAFEETIYGLEGVTTWIVDGRTLEIRPGEACCVPRGAVHGFDNHGTEDAKFLAISSPGLMTPDYFREAQEALTATAGGPPDMTKLAEVMRRHGLTPAPPAG